MQEVQGLGFQGAAPLRIASVSLARGLRLETTQPLLELLAAQITAAVLSLRNDSVLVNINLCHALHHPHTCNIYVKILVIACVASNISTPDL